MHTYTNSIHRDKESQYKNYYTMVYRILTKELVHAWLQVNDFISILPKEYTAEQMVAVVISSK